MPITWRDAMSVGDPRIDADHKSLIALINAFEKATQDEGGDDVVFDILKHLFDYTELHFQREESLQRIIGYPYCEAHRRTHQELIEQLTDLNARYVATAAGPERSAMLRDMTVFLRNWLVKHIIEKDLQLKPFIRRAAEKRAGGTIPAPPSGPAG